MVDIGRTPYRTLAHLYPDSDEVFEIEWYQARPEAPCLPYPSALNNLIWERDREEWLPTAVGEIYGAPRVYTRGAIKPLANGLHQCGTPADFAGRGVYDPLSPPVVYRDDGLPMCCGPGAVGRGGAVGGGSATVSYTGPYGGAVGGGSALVAYTHSTGGAVGGGTSGVWWGAWRVGTGGAVGGGVAPVGYGGYVVGSGGAVGGGESEVVYDPYIPITGGAVGGGESEVVYVVTEEGSGGAVGGGSADVEYTPPAYGCETYRVDWDGSDYYLDRTGPLGWSDGEWVLTASGTGDWELSAVTPLYLSAVSGWDGSG